ncbi:hypothetical protein FF098_009665 [Parvularcula flava]|uniref:Uncharacterized protein n=1 Tax=Aquisalinus luteolus TaxID=1566827 RepID=A0A8J3A488_9PROT|nr:hypothetical protein [Aquisalinus luteolus]NHK28169.1 hypothetical protein [Aquisalinus luteolus]GGH97672.1 hypothetical protein GCM10011355_19460 [Aquisalinus luteolus]
MSDNTPLYDLMLIIAVLTLLGGFFLFVVMRLITVLGYRGRSVPRIIGLLLRVGGWAWGIGAVLLGIILLLDIY